MKNRLWAAALAIALVTAAAAAPRAEIIEQIIVKVNGDIITKTEFEQRQVLALRARKVDAEPKSEELKKAVAEITPQLIVDAVDELILLQRGRDELGYKLSDEQFNQVVSQIRKDNRLDTEEAFLAALKQEGMSMADLRRSLEKQMIISRVQGQEVTQKVGITEEEALAYHAAHRDEFTKPASVTLREIQLSVPSSAARRQRGRRPGHPGARRGNSARASKRGRRSKRSPANCRTHHPRRMAVSSDH